MKAYLLPGGCTAVGLLALLVGLVAPAAPANFWRGSDIVIGAVAAMAGTWALLTEISLGKGDR